MGYRDELMALQGRMAVVQQETTGLEQQLAQLREEQRQLKRRLRRRWFGVVGRFLLAHRKLVLVIVALGGGLVALVISDGLQERQRQQALAARLGKGCRGQLKISATPAGALALIDGQRLGQLPQTVGLCPGSYRLLLVHPAAFPWQQQLQVSADQQLELGVDLVPLSSDPAAKDRSLIFADPPGTLIFIDGREVGRTPLMLHWPEGRPASVLLAAHHPEHALFLHRLRPSASFWLHLQPRQERQP